MRREPPSWWWADAGQWPATLLRPVAAIIGALGLRRFRRSRPYRSALPVICVGNLTVGGAGKTPVALMIGKRLLARGRRPAFLSRGYGGRLAGPVAVDTSRHAAADVGDEPLLLGRLAPTVVARRRDAGARAIETCGQPVADVIVMDDGFQNPTLRKDLRLLVVDGVTGLGNGLVMPAGPLRLPLAWQIDEADAFIIVGDGEPPGRRQLEASGKPILRANVLPVGGDQLRGRRVVAFAGIGRPSKLFESLAGLGAVLAASLPFADHHDYSEAEAAALIDRADRENALLVTTEKDLVRLPTGGARGELRRRSIALVVEARLATTDSECLDRLIDVALSRRPPPAPA